jgi:SAM-dependent methyltransferase
MMKNKIFIESLRCVLCGTSSLQEENDFLFCNNIDCTKSKNPYRYLLSKPLLVDFNESVLVEDNFHNKEGVSDVKRTPIGMLTDFRNLFRKKNHIANLNINLLIEKLYKIEKPRILIVGGGEIGNGLNIFYNTFSKNIISLDIYNSKYVDIIADAHKIPFIDDYFDLVIIQAVLEHVLNPMVVVSEIHRVLKPEAIVYAETPFMQQVHEGPFDFLRFSESGHRYLFKNFTLIRSGYLLGVGTSLLWSISYFFSGLFRSRLVGKLFRLFFFWVSYFDRIIPDSFNIDGASGVYFIGKKAIECISENEIISHYKGNQTNH